MSSNSAKPKTTKPAKKPSEKVGPKRKPKAANPTPVDSESAASQPAASATPAITRFETYETIVVHRSQILNAAYNPRSLDRYARQKLEKFIKRAGLLGPITWNRRTGNIVGGHQRIAALDALEETQDYSITVAAIDVPMVREKEYNIALNNPSLQGTWSVTLLEECLLEIAEESGGDITGTGFDKADLLLFDGFSPEALDSIFGEQDAAESETIQILGEIKDSAREYEKAGDSESAASDPSGAAAASFQGVETRQNSPSSDAGDNSATPAVFLPQINQRTRERELTDDELLATKPAEMSEAEHKRWLKLKRHRWTAEKNDTDDRGDEFYAVIVFNTQGELSDFLASLQLPTDQRYFSGTALMQAIGMDVGDSGEIDESELFD